MDIDVSTRALLKLALLPPGILLILLTVGWLFARRWFGRLILLLAIGGFYALSMPAAVDWLARQVETVPAPEPAALEASGADAILVLMAGKRSLNPELGGADAPNALSLERLDYGLALHRQTGLPILLSGGSVKEGSTPLAELGAAWLASRAGVKALATEKTSRDTRENLVNSAQLLRDRGLGRVLLVTHAFHMPRALLSARDAGLDAVPAPFAFMHVPAELRRPGELGDWLPQPGRLGRSYLLLHEMLGLLWYGLSR